MKHYIGTVKENCTEELRAFAGLELFMVQGAKDDDYLLVIGALELEQIEKFYKASYDSGMKEMISDDYEYCIWYCCNVTEYEKCIDEIRGTIGDKHIEESDCDLLRLIIKKY